MTLSSIMMSSMINQKKRENKIAPEKARNQPNNLLEHQVKAMTSNHMSVKWLSFKDPPLYLKIIRNSKRWLIIKKNDQNCLQKHRTTTETPLIPKD